MGNWSSGTYIASQAVTFAVYALIASTFFIKNRNAIVLITILYTAIHIVVYSLLGAAVGIGICVITIVRTIVMWIVYKKESKENRKKINPIDWVVLIVFTVISAVTTYFTFDGWLTWFGFIASTIMFIAVWQKNILAYRILGFTAECCWVVYNIAIDSFFGMLLESILAWAVAVGLITYIIEAIKARRIAAKAKASGKIQTL